jgi:CRISPR-associated protein Cmr6
MIKMSKRGKQHGKKKNINKPKQEHNVRVGANAATTVVSEKSKDLVERPLSFQCPLQSLPKLTYLQSNEGTSQQRQEGDLLEDYPMEYRAQIPGRCQRQFISEDRTSNTVQTPDVVKWLQEWVKAADEQLPTALEMMDVAKSIRIFRIKINQRLISNSGIDDGLIRPIIAAGGWPIIPGSSIKGLFRNRCRELIKCGELIEPRVIQWCGNSYDNSETKQGALRFHGAFPAKPEWRKEGGASTLDLVHPQWKWQLGHKDQSHSAFAVISLYKPDLIIPISSSDPTMTDKDWRDIENTLITAIQSNGIGGRTASGYGVSGVIEPDRIIFQCSVLGRGTASKLLNGKPEFRSTMFRAAVRGMALRIFGGLCDEHTAEQKVDELFGGITGEKPMRGILNCRYMDTNSPLLEQSRTKYPIELYTVSGRLQWSLNSLKRSVTEKQLENIKLLIESLHGLVMSLGGFGKGWRRIDHDFFGKSIKESGYTTAPIGCHWQWDDYESLPSLLKVMEGADIKTLLQTARSCALALIGKRDNLKTADWQEVIQPERTFVWTRIASSPTDSIAMKWFHAKKSEISDVPVALRLNRTEIGGRLENKKFNDGPTSVSRAWHRMYPLLGHQETPRLKNIEAKPTSNPAAFQRAQRGALVASKSVPIRFWNGPFLETFVFFPVNQNRGSHILVEGAQALINELRSLEDGSPNQFHRLEW